MRKAYNDLEIDSLDEISAVDNPAQVGARAVIFKREVGADERRHLAAEGEALPDGSFPIANLADLKNAIQAIGRAKDRDQAIAHIRRRAVALGAADLIPESFTKDRDMTDQNKDHADELVAVNKQLADANSQIVALKALSDLSDADKAFHKSLDEKGRADFLKLSSTDRAARVQAASESNAVVFTSSTGEVFRKNDDPRMIAMAKREDETARTLAAERAIRKVESLTKRAESELKNFPKEAIVKAALLAAVEGIADEATRTAVGEMLKAGNDALAKHFKEIGAAGESDTASSEQAHEKLEKIAKGLQAADAKLDTFGAYRKACELNPELYEQAVGTSVGEES